MSPVRCSYNLELINAQDAAIVVIQFNIYRPPRCNNNNSTLREFCQELNPVISNISKNNNDVVITGDFNIDLLQINERSEIQKYFDLFANPNDNYNKFEDIILNAKAKFLSPKIVRFKKYKHKLSPWMTNGILQSLKFKDKLYLDMKATKQETEKYESLKSHLQAYNSLLKNWSDRQKLIIMQTNLAKISQI